MNLENCTSLVNPLGGPKLPFSFKIRGKLFRVEHVAGVSSVDRINNIIGADCFHDPERLLRTIKRAVRPDRCPLEGSEALWNDFLGDNPQVATWAAWAQDEIDFDYHCQDYGVDPDDRRLGL